MVSLRELLNLNLPVVLASASPRRKYLLEQIGLSFTTRHSSFPEESVPLTLPPDAYVQQLALAKAQDVAAALDQPALVIGADTTVVLDGAILNKPTDAAEASAMLARLSGRTHTVYTGIALINTATAQSDTAVQCTEVTFRALAPREIEVYVATGSPLDKAGAYGIQDDFGAVFVERINGCYYNVVGLPLPLLYSRMSRFGGSEGRNQQ